MEELFKNCWLAVGIGIGIFALLIVAMAIVLAIVLAIQGATSEKTWAKKKKSE